MKFVVPDRLTSGVQSVGHHFRAGAALASGTRPMSGWHSPAHFSTKASGSSMSENSTEASSDISPLNDPQAGPKYYRRPSLDLAQHSYRYLGQIVNTLNFLSPEWHRKSKEKGRTADGIELEDELYEGVPRTPNNSWTEVRPGCGRISWREDPSPILHASSPNGQQGCEGLYLLVVGEAANDLPLWRHSGGRRWLFSSRTGRWCICGMDVAADGFFRCSGFLYQESLHGGRMPYSATHSWLRWDGRGFVADSDIRVTNGVSSDKEGAASEVFHRSCPVPSSFCLLPEQRRRRSQPV